MRKTILFICVVFVCLTVSITYYTQNLLSQPVFDGETHYVVDSGASVKQIAAQVAANKHSWDGLVIEFYARWASRNNAIKAGKFNVPEHTNIREFFRILIAGKVVEYSFTVPEGWGYREMLAALSGLNRIQHPSEGYNIDDIAQILGVESDVSIEGLFFPDTYSYYDGALGMDLLERAYRVMQDQLAEIWEGRSSESMASEVDTPYKALILASIIEKETGKAGERVIISGVFHNRLRMGMKLQTDPTVIYGLGDEYDGNIRRVDLKTDTPYNTYTRFGLPPGPISLPGRLALQAAVNPEPTTALFFVANGKGGHTFSDTLAEHERAVAEYLRAIGR